MIWRKRWWKQAATKSPLGRPFAPSWSHVTFTLSRTGVVSMSSSSRSPKRIENAAISFFYRQCQCLNLWEQLLILGPAPWLWGAHRYFAVTTNLIFGWLSLWQLQPPSCWWTRLAGGLCSSPPAPSLPLPSDPLQSSCSLETLSLSHSPGFPWSPSSFPS